MFLYQRPKKRIGGFALISILVFISLLSLIAFEFSRRSGINLKMTVNYAYSKKALYYALGGYQAALALLMSDTNEYDGSGDIWYGILPPIPFESGMMLVSIEDEKGRFNIKKLVAAQESEYTVHERSRAMLTRMFEALSLEPELIDALIDWQDSDDTSLLYGAEEAYYNALSPSYLPRNEPVVTSGELLLIKGFDHDLYFLPPSSRAIGVDEELNSLNDCITVYGDGKININTASMPVLLSLSKDMDKFIARDIIEYREENPFHKVEDLKEVESVYDVLYDEIESLITVKSDIFRIIAHGTVDEFISTVTAVVMRQSRGFRVVYFNRSL